MKVINTTWECNEIALAGQSSSPSDYHGGDPSALPKPMAFILDIPIGSTGHAEMVVADEHTAPRVGSGKIAVLATPVMINLIEAAALAAIEHLLPAATRAWERTLT